MATIEQQKRKLEKALKAMHPDGDFSSLMREKYRELEKLEKQQKK